MQKPVLNLVNPSTYCGSTGTVVGTGRLSALDQLITLRLPTGLDRARDRYYSHTGLHTTFAEYLLLRTRAIRKVKHIRSRLHSMGRNGVRRIVNKEGISIGTKLRSRLTMMIFNPS